MPIIFIGIGCFFCKKCPYCHILLWYEKEMQSTKNFTVLSRRGIELESFQEMNPVRNRHIGENRMYHQWIQDFIYVRVKCSYFFWHVFTTFLFVFSLSFCSQRYLVYTDQCLRQMSAEKLIFFNTSLLGLLILFLNF